MSETRANYQTLAFTFVTSVMFTWAGDLYRAVGSAFFFGLVLGWTVGGRK